MRAKTVWDETGLESRLPKKLEKPFAGIAVNALFALRFIRVAPMIEQGWDFVFVARAKTPQVKSTQLMPVLKKTDFEPYISGQPEKGTEWKKAASKNKKRREELNPFCDMEFFDGNGQVRYAKR